MVEAGTAVLAIALATGAALLIERFTLDNASFPLLFPAIAAAALIAGWRSGLIVIIGCQLLSWYLLVPVRGSFAVATNGDAVNLAVTTAAALILLGLVSRYREAQKATAFLLQDQGRQLEQSIALLRQQAETDKLLLEQEAALRASRSNLEAIYEASGDGLALCEAIRDEAGRVVEYQVIEVNRAHAELTSATREQMLSKRISTIYPPIDPRWFETAEKVLDTGLMHDFDIRSRANGRWLNIRVSRVSDRLFQQTFVDVSDRHRLEEQRRAMLKEMSHRVTNNFQMIAAFLRLQAVAADPAAKAQLQTAQRRIQVLARLHSLLAYTESESVIDVGAYIKELCGHLAATIERPDAVALVCETAELRLATEKVVPLGFIVSELVTNSAKYAFPAPLSGTIRVALYPRSGGWTLTIEDDGMGIDHTETHTGGGLGTKLVDRFARQIDATLVTRSDHGVHHRIDF